MPVEFLPEEQQRRYGCYSEAPSPLQLARSFHFDDRDHQLIARPQRDAYRLGFAIQLGTVRFLGTFLPDPTHVPATGVAYVAQQLGLDVPCAWSPTTRAIRIGIMPPRFNRAYGYRDFHDPREVLPPGPVAV